MIKLRAVILALLLALMQLPSTALENSSDWPAQFDNAMRLRAEGKLNDAVSILQDILHGQNDYANGKQYGDTLYACYSIYMIMGDWHGAEAMFNNALARDRHHHDGYLADLGSDMIELGNCRYQLKQFKKACECYASALKLRKESYGENSPYVGAVQWRYAKALRAMGEWQKAARLTEASYSTLPVCAHCRTNEGMCPIYYGDKTIVVSPREFVRMDYFDGGKTAGENAPRFWCTKCSRTY